MAVPISNLAHNLVHDSVSRSLCHIYWTQNSSKKLSLASKWLTMGQYSGNAGYDHYCCYLLLLLLLLLSLLSVVCYKCNLHISAKSDKLSVINSGLSIRRDNASLQHSSTAVNASISKRLHVSHISQQSMQVLVRDYTYHTYHSSQCKY